MKREEQKAQREEEILLTALDLFTRKGYAATKTSEISKVMGISDGLLFHYFKSKEVLLETLVDIATKENNSWIEKECEHPLQYFRDVTEAVLKSLKEDAVSSKFFVLIGQLRQHEDIPERIRQKVAVQEERVQKTMEIIIKGQEMGQIRQGDPLALLYLYNDTIQSIAMGLARHKKIPFPEADWVVDMLKNHTVI